MFHPLFVCFQPTRGEPHERVDTVYRTQNRKYSEVDDTSVTIKETTMTTVFVRAKVADFATWKAAYDSGLSFRDAAGVTSASVYRSVDNPNEVTISHELNTVRAAKDFAHSNDLRAAMQQSGVVGAPEVWFVESV